MQKIIKILILILFFTISLVFSHIGDFFLDKNIFLVSGNYEFFKVIFFNIFSSLIIILFFLKNFFYKNILFPKNILFYIFYFIVLISTIFSESPYISFFGNTNKAHSFLMINNLFGIFIVLINLEKNFRKKLLNTIIYSSFFISIFAIHQYFWPSFDYGDLSNRALGSFGHPNYLSLFLLLVIPSLYDKIFKQNKNLFSIILFFIIFALFLTKSAFGILIFIFYNFYFFGKKILKTKNFFYKFGLFSILFLVFSGIFIYQIYPEKLSSFLSRFFIWQTTIDIIFSNFKNIIIGSGAETLSYFFLDFKNTYLYIFENYGFSADRPHNLFLNFFFHFGIFSLFILFYFLFSLKKLKSSFYLEAIILFFIFSFLNFSSISTYLILLFFISSIFYKNKNIKNNFFTLIFFLIILCFSIINLYYSPKFYLSETKAYLGQNKEASEIFHYNPINFYVIGNAQKGLKIEKIKGRNYYLSQITNTKNLIKTCEQLVKKHPSAENYFLCGGYIENFENKEKAKIFYKKGLEKLPDLWNKNSKYNNLFIQKFVDKKRFFSKKYGNFREILEKIKN